VKKKQITTNKASNQINELKFEIKMRRNRYTMEEGAGSWGRLHSEKLHNLYASPYVVMVIKSRRMR